MSRGGVPKRAVVEARIGVLGVDGDAHRARQYHGGPERAVCLFPLEAIDALRAEGHDVEPGALGENVTVHGLDWEAVVPGARLLLGGAVLLEVTRYTTPCATISASFLDGDVSRVSQKRHPGWSRVYARVLAEGRISAGDPVRLIDAAAAALAGRPESPTATPR